MMRHHRTMHHINLIICCATVVVGTFAPWIAVNWEGEVAVRVAGAEWFDAQLACLAVIVATGAAVVASRRPRASARVAWLTAAAFGLTVIVATLHWWLRTSYEVPDDKKIAIVDFIGENPPRIAADVEWGLLITLVGALVGLGSAIHVAYTTGGQTAVVSNRPAACDMRHSSLRRISRSP